MHVAVRIPKVVWIRKLIDISFDERRVLLCDDIIVALISLMVIGFRLHQRLQDLAEAFFGTGAGIVDALDGLREVVVVFEGF